VTTQITTAKEGDFLYFPHRLVPSIAKLGKCHNCFLKTNRWREMGGGGGIAFCNPKLFSSQIPLNISPFWEPKELKSIIYYFRPKGIEDRPSLDQIV